MSADDRAARLHGRRAVPTGFVALAGESRLAGPCRA
jgi:hypothetical protein